MNRSALLVSSLVAFLLLSPYGFRGVAAEAVVAQPPPVKAEETNSQDLLRSYLQLQEQLHEAQLAINETRKEARENALKNTETLTAQLKSLEALLNSQRARELDAMQSSNRVMLVMAGLFAALGFIAMVLMAYFQWRTVHGLAQISAALPSVGALSPGRQPAVLGTGEFSAVSSVAAESSARLLGAVGELEKRIHGLEQSSRLALKPGNGEPETAPNGNGKTDAANGAAAGPSAPGEEEPASLLARGQALLDQDQPAAALACFEQALVLAPAHGEALVKKGSALERLGQLQEAVECYDQAIAADRSLTLAYLHKGGLFNRMEKFAEALECYEKALQTQEKKEA